MHQTQLGRTPQVLTGQRAQDVPDHLGVGQFAVQGLVVVLVAPPHIEPIRFGRNDPQHRLAGQEVRENSHRHRLAIHFAMVSACSLRAPGVVK